MARRGNNLARILGALGGGFLGAADARNRHTREKQVADNEAREARGEAFREREFSANEAHRKSLRDKELADEQKELSTRQAIAALYGKAQGGDKDAIAELASYSPQWAEHFKVREPNPPAPNYAGTNQHAEDLRREQENEAAGLAAMSSHWDNEQFRDSVNRMIATNTALYAKRPGLAAYNVVRSMQRPPVPEGGEDMGASPFATAPTTGVPGQKRTVVLNGKTYELP